MCPMTLMKRLTRSISILAATVAVFVTSAGTSKADLIFTLNNANVGPWGTGPFGTVTVSSQNTSGGQITLAWQADPNNPSPGSGFFELGINTTVFNSTIENSARAALITPISGNAASWSAPANISGNVDSRGYFSLQWGTNGSNAATSGTIVLKNLGEYADLSYWLAPNELGNYVFAHVQPGNGVTGYVAGSSQVQGDVGMPLPPGLTMMASGIFCGLGGIVLKRRRAMK